MVNHLEKLSIKGSEQWVLVRGYSQNTPLLIHAQAGPGLPIIPEARVLGRMLKLEQHFLVAYWDQRGCGKSYSKKTDPETISLEQLSEDLIALTKQLLSKYQKGKAVVVGYSVGATLGLIAATKAPEIFDRLFLAGMDIDISTANRYAFEFVKSKAKQLNKNKLYKEAVVLSKTPVTNAQSFQKRARLLTDLGGIRRNTSYNKLLVSSILNMISCKEYSLSDIPKTIKGMEFCQNALLEEMDTLNLFEKVEGVGIPVCFIQGTFDGIAPYQTAQKYFEFLDAKEKTFIEFDSSAHMPHYDEPEKFTRIIIEFSKIEK